MKKAILGMVALMVAATSSCWGLGFLVTPPRFEFLLAPGQSQTYQVTVINIDSVNSVRLQAMMMDWSMKTSGQTAYFKPGTLDRSCSSWIDVNPADFVVGPQATQDIRFTVKVPDSTFGSYHSMIFFESQPDTAPQAAIGVVMKAKVGTAIYVTIPGTEVRQAEFIGFSYQRKGYLNHEFKLQVKNTGNVHLRPKGTLTIKNGGGATMATLPLNDEVILPQSQRDLLVPLNQELAPGRYTAVINLDCGTPELLQGETVFEVSK